MMYLIMLEDLRSTLEAVYTILADERTEKPNIDLYDLSWKDPYKDNCFIPINIFEPVYSLEEFIENFRRCRGRCGGFRVTSQLDADGDIIALLDYPFAPGIQDGTCYTIRASTLQSFDGNDGKDADVPLPLYMQSIFEKHGGTVLEVA